MASQDNSQVYRVIDIFYHGIVISNEEKVMRLSDYDLTNKNINGKELLNTIHPSYENVNKYKHDLRDTKGEKIIRGGDHNDYQSRQLFYYNEGKNIDIMQTHPQQTDITKWSVKLHINNPELSIGTSDYNKYYSAMGKPTKSYTLRLNDKVFIDITKSTDKKIWICYKNNNDDKNANGIIESFSRFLFDVKEYPIASVADNVIIMDRENENDQKSIFLSCDVRTGLYRVAGGHVEKGEDNTKGGNRELTEETRLRFEDIKNLITKEIRVDRHLLSNVQESRRGVVLYLMEDMNAKNIMNYTAAYKVSFVDQNNETHNLLLDKENIMTCQDINKKKDEIENEIENVTLSYYTEDVLVEVIKGLKSKYHYFKHNYLLYEDGKNKHLYRAVGDMVDKHTMISSVTYRYLSYNEEMKGKLYWSKDEKEKLVSEFLPIQKYNDLKSKNLFHWNTHIGLIDRGILYASDLININDMSYDNIITFRVNKKDDIYVDYNIPSNNTSAISPILTNSNILSTPIIIPEAYDYDFFIHRNRPHNNTHYYVVLTHDTTSKVSIPIQKAIDNIKTLNFTDHRKYFPIELLSDIADGMCYIKRLIGTPINDGDKNNIAVSKENIIKRVYDYALEYYKKANEYDDRVENEELDYTLLYNMLYSCIRPIRFLLSVDNINIENKEKVEGLKTKILELDQIIMERLRKEYDNRYSEDDKRVIEFHTYFRQLTNRFFS